MNKVKLMVFTAVLASFLPQTYVKANSLGREGGGGNGVNGIVLEHYSQNIKDLPEYKRFVEPMFEQLSSKLPHFASVIHEVNFLKTFYFVPIALDALPKEEIGVSFRTDQMALQTRNSVWVNKVLYDKMPGEAKAILLVHELMMGLKLNIGSHFLCEPLSNSQCALRILSSTDYDAVRTLTVSLMKNLNSLTKEELRKVVKGLGFGKYLTESLEIDPNHPLLKVPSTAELFRILDSENSQKRLPQFTKDKRGCAYVLKLNELNEQLNIKIYDERNGYPFFSNLPFEMNLSGKPLVYVSKKGISYVYEVMTKDHEYKKSLQVTFTDRGVRRVEANWLKSYYDFMTQTYIWKKSEKPDYTTSPNHKTCY